ncbi:F0F1 ATP synthase subunit alpha [Cupriavidus numazuensis]|uniref:ATP synthase subunit alpha n=1 Tax=Cupriavidus numazuensis TaxID=221992 RepID=A0ABM8TMT8_9BURK|nr:F0F1 ATP synthase subunit alpha [Cupriavidus numazuensis]CAG2155344.1 ATP synthase subunit alpha [Cupriavidus numazuensis]
MNTPQIGLAIEEVGTVVGVADGIAWLQGLPSVPLGEVLRSPDGSRAWVFQLDENLTGCILLDQTEGLAAGTRMRRSGQRLTLACADALLGRVIDPLGRALDDQPLPPVERQQPLEARSPAIIDRDPVTRPLYTGNTVIDTLLPIGRGQRELLIGDESTGKSSLALDAIIHQRDQAMRCVLVLIGQRRAEVAETIHLLNEHDAMSHTTIVVAEAGGLPGLQYLAPFAGCALAESWMQAGHDTLIVYDDLGKHAQAYRELSLLMRRPPGREAYPGDIFYLHARLLERSTQLNAARGGGSMTALPIVPTQLGEVASYIPTNLISITDGQVYLSSKLVAAGTYPAIDLGISVSRIGGKAQARPIARECKHLRLDYLQFLELELFLRFGTRLDDETEARVRRGRLVQALLRQDRLEPRPIAFQMAWLVALNEGWLDGLEPSALQAVLDTLQLRVRGNDTPGLDAPRQQWVAAVRAWTGREP